MEIAQTSVRCTLGEGPTWVARLNSLMWVDIVGRRIHMLDLATREVAQYDLDEPVGWIVERAGRNDFLIGLKSGIAEFDLATGKARPLVALESDRPDNRLNDAKVDRFGVLWAGTKDDTDRSASGALYRIDRALKPVRVDDRYGVTNGPTFSLDGSTMYHADSAAKVIYAFDVDEDRTICGRRVWLEFKEDWGYPDGMTTDAEGCIWVAHWGGGRVSRFAPTGELMRSIHLPATNITSCAFAGPELDLMFVTTSTLGYEHEPQAGALFQIEPGVAGLKPTPFAG